MLIQGPNVLSTGADITIDGPLISAIAYVMPKFLHVLSLVEASITILPQVSPDR